MQGEHRALHLVALHAAGGAELQLPFHRPDQDGEPHGLMQRFAAGLEQCRSQPFRLVLRHEE